MTKQGIKRALGCAAGLLALSAGVTATSAAAAPVITNVNADISASSYTFSFMGGTYTVDGRGGFPNYLSIATTGGAAVRTVFGTPSTDFTDRGTVIYDQNTLGGYGSFPSLTSVPATNGNNYLGLRVTSGGQNYYGFLFTTNSTLNSYGFETTAGAGINPTAALAAAAAVPEPASWAMLIGGFGVAGAAMRRRRATRVSFA